MNSLPNKRKLGFTEFEISEIGLGCWQLGGDFGPMQDQRAHDILQTAVDQGINFFDTADVYGGGRSEIHVGNELGAKKEIIIATKYGRDGNTYPDKYSLSDMRNSIKRAQDRLQRDVIDLIQLHCVPPQVLQKGDIFDWLRSVQQEGLIKHFGASVETMDEAILCAQQSGMASLQIIFNMLRQRPKEQLFDLAVQNQVGIIVRLPLASGLLSGKYSATSTFAEGDHRNYNRDGAAFSVGETFSGIKFEKGLQIIEDLKQFKPASYSMAQFAVRWILDHPAVSTVIAGASSPQQVQENVSVSSLAPLDAKSHEKLYDYFVKEVESHIRGVY